MSHTIFLLVSVVNDSSHQGTGFYDFTIFFLLNKNVRKKNFRNLIFRGVTGFPWSIHEVNLTYLSQHAFFL